MKWNDIFCGPPDGTVTNLTNFSKLYLFFVIIKWLVLNRSPKQQGFLERNMSLPQQNY